MFLIIRGDSGEKETKNTQSYLRTTCEKLFTLERKDFTFKHFINALLFHGWMWSRKQLPEIWRCLFSWLKQIPESAWMTNALEENQRKLNWWRVFSPELLSDVCEVSWGHWTGLRFEEEVIGRKSGRTLT